MSPVAPGTTTIVLMRSSSKLGGEVSLLYTQSADELESSQRKSDRVRVKTSRFTPRENGSDQQ
jgi:hypothetical protein